MALPMRMGVWSSWSMARVLQQEVEYYYYYYKTVTSSQPKQRPWYTWIPSLENYRAVYRLTNLYWMSILNVHNIISLSSKSLLCRYIYYYPGTQPLNSSSQHLTMLSILNNIYIHSFNQDTIIYVTLMNSVLVSGIVKITQIFVT